MPTRTRCSRAAVRWGLAIGPAPDPRSAALTLAHTLADRDPTALRLAKLVIDSGDNGDSLALERIAEAFLYAQRSAREDRSGDP